MSRAFTLFTGQWADLPLEEVCRLAQQWGYDGLELACWGDHFEVDRALGEDGYLAGRHALLAKYGLRCWAISNHLVGQAVCDHPIDARHQGILPARIWGDGEPEGVRQRAAAELADTARAAAAFGVATVVGFTGSSIWHTVAMFPPVPPEMIEAGYADFAARWNPILDVFDAEGVRFAHEVHPSEIAYDFWTTRRALDAVGNRPAFGLNFDPSHFVWQDLDPVAFLGAYPDRIYHVDCKEARTRLDGRNGRLGSHLPWGDPRRGWDFVSAGRGEVRWEDVFRMLNSIGYQGPISVEWEDAGMDRLAGAPEALAYLKHFDLEPPARLVRRGLQQLRSHTPAPRYSRRLYGARYGAAPSESSRWARAPAVGSAIRAVALEACLGMAHHCRVQCPNQVCQPWYRSARSAASAAVDCSAASGIEVAPGAPPRDGSVAVRYWPGTGPRPPGRGGRLRCRTGTRAGPAAQPAVSAGAAEVGAGQVGAERWPGARAAVGHGDPDGQPGPGHLGGEEPIAPAGGVPDRVGREFGGAHGDVRAIGVVGQQLGHERAHTGNLVFLAGKDLAPSHRTGTASGVIFRP